MKQKEQAKKMTKAEWWQKRIEAGKESLLRAEQPKMTCNDAICMKEFSARGIPESEIRPRENIFTYNGWLAKGRQVQRGEHGVRGVVWRPELDLETGETELRPEPCTMFHISQTKPLEERRAA